MSSALEAIEARLKELDVQELTTLQALIATKLSQKQSTEANLTTSAGTKPPTTPRPIGAKFTTIEEIKKNPPPPPTPEEVQASLEALARMRALAEEIGKDYPGEFDAVEAVNEGRMRNG